MTASILGPRGNYSVQAGQLRHRVSVQYQVKSRGALGGTQSTWKDFAKNVPAAMEDISGDERTSAQQVHSLLTTAISFRWRPGLLPSMRVVHAPKGEVPTIYNILYIQRDTTGRNMVTLYCDSRNSDGYRADGR